MTESTPENLGSDDNSLPERTLFVVGPTASGKSSIALELAQYCHGEIVNADAFQLYRGLDVLTAKPTPEDLSRIPHHLYSVLDSARPIDAQSYRDLALPVIREIAGRGQVPIVTGGSGLYIKALTHGLAKLPAADPTLRARFEKQSLEEKVAELLRLDPAATTNVPLQNPRYVERALEVCLLTGRPQSELRQSFVENLPSVQGVALQLERDVLYDRINRRTEAMIEQGIAAEVAALGDLQTGAAKAIGVREMRDHLAGQATLTEATAALQQATRRYAKRQFTWFRRETCFQTICLPKEPAAESTVDEIVRLFPWLQPTPSSSDPSPST
jgi:tRNA dimethylallyltransferase